MVVAAEIAPAAAAEAAGATKRLRARDTSVERRCAAERLAFTSMLIDPRLTWATAADVNRRCQRRGS